MCTRDHANLCHFNRLVYSVRGVARMSRAQELLMDEHGLRHGPPNACKKPGGMVRLTEFFRNLFGLRDNSLH